MSKLSIMFVCLGNICRSPLAEAVFKLKLQQAGLSSKIHVRSSGTADYHVGEDADARTRKVAALHEVPMQHTAQQFILQDFFNNDYILVMDDSNLSHVEQIRPQGSTAELMKFRYFDPMARNMDMPDPWFGLEDGFEENYQITERSCAALLDFLIRHHKL